MHLRVLALAALTVSFAAFAQSPAPDAFQVAYAQNLNVGDSVINFTSAGTVNGLQPAGNICVNVYAFDPAEELISCCACQVTPNSSNSLSVRGDLLSNTFITAMGPSQVGCHGHVQLIRPTP